MGNMCFIAGVQKCGTSTMYALLCQHPELGGAQRWETGHAGFPPKELHVFNTGAFKRGDGWYRSHFGSHRWWLDATPEYITKYSFVKRMHRFDRSGRVILMLRDPVKRAVSAWRHWSRLPNEEKWVLPCPGGTWLDNIREESRHVAHMQAAKEFTGFLSRGLYADQLEMLHELYGKERVKVVFLEDVVRNPDEQVRNIQQWLGVHPFAAERRHVNEGTSPSVDKAGGEETNDDALPFLRDFFLSHNSRLEQLLSTQLPEEWSR